MVRLSAAVVVFLGACVVLTCYAGEPAGIGALADALASSNDAPVLIRRPGPTTRLGDLPAGFDPKAQERVYAAWDGLLAAGSASLPHLIDHLDDRRYSVTEFEEGRDGWANHNVAYVCRRAIESLLYVYPPYVLREVQELGVAPRRVCPARYPLNLDSKQEVDKWWQSRKQLTLRDLQIEVLRWAINVEQQRGFTDLDEEAKVLGPLKYVLKRIEDTGKPVLPKRPIPDKRL